MTVYEMLDAVRDLPEGDYAEVGVWQGWMAHKIYRGMNRFSKLWLFDTFSGHLDPGEHDLPEFHPKGRYSDTSIADIVKKFPDANVWGGPISKTLHTVNHGRFRFVNIDLDHYEPTKLAANFFRSRMVPGGIIRFDDYNHPETPGATRAIDEVFGRENILPKDFHWIA